MTMATGSLPSPSAAEAWEICKPLLMLCNWSISSRAVSFTNSPLNSKCKPRQLTQNHVKRNNSAITYSFGWDVPTRDVCEEVCWILIGDHGEPTRGVDEIVRGVLHGTRVNDMALAQQQHCVEQIESTR